MSLTHEHESRPSSTTYGIDMDHHGKSSSHEVLVLQGRGLRFGMELLRHAPYLQHEQH